MATSTPPRWPRPHSASSCGRKAGHETYIALRILGSVPKNLLIRSSTWCPTPPCQGVLIQPPCRLILSQRPQVEGEVVGREQGVGVLLTQHPAPQPKGTLGERHARRCFSACLQVKGGLVEQPRDVIACVIESTAGVSGSQNVREEPSPFRPGAEVVSRLRGDGGAQ